MISIGCLLFLIIEPDPIRNMVIHSISNNSVNVSWNAPISLKGIIINYHVAIMTKNLINNKWILNSSARHFIIEDLSKIFHALMK